MNTAEDAEDWTFGITALMENLAARGLLSSHGDALLTKEVVTHHAFGGVDD